MSSAGGGGGRVRIYGPPTNPDKFFTCKRKRESVVARIETICREAKLDDADVDRWWWSLGLLDPASNIHVNSVIFAAAAADAAPPGGGSNNNGGGGGSISMAQRSLDGLVVFLTCLFPYLPDAEATAYLDAAGTDPLAAALLVIARRGWTRRFGYCSATTVAAVDAALRCAAVAAHHPDPHLFVQGWRRVSRALAAASHLSGDGSMDHAVARLLVQSPPSPPHQRDELELEQPWELARRRLAATAVPAAVGRDLPPVPESSMTMKRMLVATIHGFYLTALGSLPEDALARRLHRSLLRGGYCYGPLDPVANIVVNTVWHEGTFPTSNPFEVAMVSTSSLWRVAARSMHSLVSFLCTRYPRLSPDLALQRLLAAGGSLRAADPHLFDQMPTPAGVGGDQVLDWSDCPQVGSVSNAAVAQIVEAQDMPSATVQEAYAAAAIAAFHACTTPPEEFHACTTPPEEEIRRRADSDGWFCLEDYRPLLSEEQFDVLSMHTELLGSRGSVEKLRAATAALRLHEGRPISKEQLDSLCVQVSRCSSSSDGMPLRQREPEPEEVGSEMFVRLSVRAQSFWGQHDAASSMVAAALEKFNRTEGSQYRVHVICGVNDHVIGPVLCSSHRDRGFSAHFPFKFLHSHINFLATRLDKEPDDDENPTKLFFSECSNDDHHDSWCVPVRWSHPDAGQAARCFYCESRQIRIIHPAVPCFHGSDLGETFFGSSKKAYHNDCRIIRYPYMVHYVEDDAIYQNYRVRDDDNGDSGYPRRFVAEVS